MVIRHPYEHGMLFAPPHGCRWRTERLRQVVLHWTGGEGSARQVYDTLRRRRLGVHYVVDRGGAVWHMADVASVATYHAGRANGCSVGVEIVCCGVGHSDRESYKAQIHGRTIEVCDFYPHQITSVVELVDQLCDQYDIRRDVQRATTRVSGIEDYEGVCGHYHWSKRKIDPGPQIFYRLARHWGLL